MSGLVRVQGVLPRNAEHLHRERRNGWIAVGVTVSAGTISTALAAGLRAAMGSLALLHLVGRWGSKSTS